MSKNKVIKPVSFNITKEQDNQMLKHVKRKNFSGYVKKLILADMEAKTKGVEEVKEEAPHKAIKKEASPVKESAADRLKSLKEKTKRQQVSKPTPPPFKPKG